MEAQAWRWWVKMAKVEVYSSMLCGFCYRAKKLLEQKGVAFTEIDVMVNPSRRAEMVQRSGGRTSVPQIFIDDRHIGGCDELYALESRKKLDSLLQPAS
jgi:glutaredoxin 3